MNRLNKTFHNNDILDAQELNDIVGKTNELVDAANTAAAVTGVAVTNVEGEMTEDGFVVSVSKEDGDTNFTIPTSETMTSAGLMTLDDKAKLDGIGEGASKEILPYDGEVSGVVVTDIYVIAPDGVYWNGTRFIAKKDNAYYIGWNDEEGEYVNVNAYQESGAVKMDKVFYDKSNGDRKVTKTGTDLVNLGSDVDLSAYLTKVEAAQEYATNDVATAAYDGLMSAADKAKLDDIDGWTHEALHIAAIVENITPESVSPAGPAQDICFDSVRNSFYWRLYNRFVPIEEQEVKYALSTAADGSLNAYNKDGQWFTMGDRCFVWFSTGFREVLAANLEDYVKKTDVATTTKDGIMSAADKTRLDNTASVLELEVLGIAITEIDGKLRKRYTDAGATYDEDTGYYSLNGLTDITDEQMSVIYADTYRKQCGKDMSYMLAGSKARTNFPARNRKSSESGLITSLLFGSCSNMEVIKWGEPYSEEHTSPLQYYGHLSTCTEMFNGCASVHTIIGAIDMESITAKPINMFGYCNSLVNVQILGLKTSLDLQSPVISHDSLMFLVQHAANTSAVTVKVAQGVLDKVSGDSAEWGDIYTAALAKNISFGV